MNTNHEWNRVRVHPNTYACNRYSWLRPANPHAIAFVKPDSLQLTHVTDRPGRPPRVRAPRVDEAQAVLDVQIPIDDLHSLDRQKLFMARHYFHPGTLVLNRHPGDHAEQLQIAVTKQHLGERYWWSCPTCGRRARFLYHFFVGRPPKSIDPESVLACRSCLGLTYASRSQHRCPTHDERRARQGDLQAAMRTITRIDKKTRGDLATLEAIRRRLQKDAHALGVQLPTERRH